MCKEECPYDFRLAEVVSKLKEIQARKVLVQLPNGLKKYYPILRTTLEDLEIEVFLSLSHSWGVCDLALGEAKKTMCDTILHVGHHGQVALYTLSDIKIVCSPAFYKRNPIPLATRGLKLLMAKGCKRIGLFTTAQHLNYFQELREALSEAGAKVHTTQIFPWMPGQIIGCRFDTIVSNLDRKVDAYLVVGGGIFHGLGLFVTTNKPVIIADPYSNRLIEVAEEASQILKKRLFKLMEALDKKNYAVVISTKIGQFRLALAQKIRDLLRGRGKVAELVVADEISPSLLLNIPWAQAFVIVACPRIAIDHQEEYPYPLLNPGEVKYVLRGSLEEYTPKDSLVPNLSLNNVA